MSHCRFLKDLYSAERLLPGHRTQRLELQGAELPRPVLPTLRPPPAASHYVLFREKVRKYRVKAKAEPKTQYETPFRLNIGNNLRNAIRFIKCRLFALICLEVCECVPRADWRCQGSLIGKLPLFPSSCIITTIISSFSGSCNNSREPAGGAWPAFWELHLWVQHPARLWSPASSHEMRTLWENIPHIIQKPTGFIYNIESRFYTHTPMHTHTKHENSAKKKCKECKMRRRWKARREWETRVRRATHPALAQSRS